MIDYTTPKIGPLNVKQKKIDTKKRTAKPIKFVKQNYKTFCTHSPTVKKVCAKIEGPGFRIKCILIIWSYLVNKTCMIQVTLLWKLEKCTGTRNIKNGTENIFIWESGDINMDRIFFKCWPS